MTPKREPVGIDGLRRPEAPEVITVRQFAAIVHTSTDAVYEGIARKTFPFPVLRIGRCIRIPVKPLLAALGYEVEDADCREGQE
jgi:hypothetical protein